MAYNWRIFQSSNTSHTFHEELTSSWTIASQQFVTLNSSTRTRTLWLTLCSKVKWVQHKKLPLPITYCFKTRLLSAQWYSTRWLKNKETRTKFRLTTWRVTWVCIEIIRILIRLRWFQKSTRTTRSPHGIKCSRRYLTLWKSTMRKFKLKNKASNKQGHNSRRPLSTKVILSESIFHKTPKLKHLSTTLTCNYISRTIPLTK